MVVVVFYWLYLSHFWSYRAKRTAIRRALTCYVECNSQGKHSCAGRGATSQQLFCLFASRLGNNWSCLLSFERTEGCQESFIWSLTFGVSQTAVKSHPQGRNLQNNRERTRSKKYTIDIIWLHILAPSIWWLLGASIDVLHDWRDPSSLSVLSLSRQSPWETPISFNTYNHYIKVVFAYNSFS